MMRRRGAPLLAAAATTAVVAGTAGAVRHHQDQKYAQQDYQQQQMYAAQAAAAAPAEPQVVYVQAPPAPAPMPAAAPAPAAGGSDLTAQLQQLSQLHNAGVLSDAEFAAAKQKLGDHRRVRHVPDSPVQAPQEAVDVASQAHVVRAELVHHVHDAVG